MTSTPTALKVCLLFVLAACSIAWVAGCGGGGGSPTPVQTAPTNLSYSHPTIAAELNQAIPADTPTVTGTVASYAASPALPAGLALSSTTGTISGTPTVSSAVASYIVTATNPAGSTTATVQISVAVPVQAPSGLTYPQTAISATVGQAIAADTPAVTGTVTSYTVSPTLPAGLALDGTAGTISGTPTTVSASAAYTVTASNSAGSTKASVQIAVAAAAVVAPTALTYPQTSIDAFVGQAIAFDTPTVTGVVTGYAVNPALPAGLTLSPTNGAISGTPAAVTAVAAYTVTASNAGGSTTATVEIEVDSLPAAPTALMYPQPTIAIWVGQSITPNLPATAGGPVSSYSVSPALPAGMAIDPATGVISGTPTAEATQANYVVTGSNAAGSATASLALTVSAAPIVLLGANTQLFASILQFANSSVFTEDDNGIWVLRNYASGAVLANGDAGHGGTALDSNTSEYVPLAQMAGPTLAIQVPGGIELRSSADGHVLGDIVSPGYVISQGLEEIDTWQLAADGSYIALETASGLYAYAPSGKLLFSLPGNYIQAADNTGIPSGIFAAPGQIQVAGGPANAGAVETISVPGGTSSLGPAYQGSFCTWFADGAHFATGDTSGSPPPNSTVWVYSSSSTQQAAVPLQGCGQLGQLGGWGNWMWVNGSLGQGNQATVSVYPIGSTTPALTDNSTITEIVPSGSTIALIPQYNGDVGVIDMSGATPVETEYPLPSSSDYAYTFYNVDVPYASWGGKWVALLDLVIGDTDYEVSDEYSQVVVDGTSLATNTPRYFGRGPIVSMAAGANTVAIAAGQQVSWFNPANAAPQGSVEITSGQVALSSDGTLLGAAAANNSAVNLYSTSSGSLSNNFSYPSGNSNQFSFSLSGNGSILGTTVGSYNQGTETASYSVQVTPTSGNSGSWSTSYAQILDLPTVISPDGTLVAVTEDNNDVPNVLIYKNGTLQATVSGQGMGWLDNGHLLSQNVASSVASTGTAIYGPAGALLSTSPLTQLRVLQVVNPTTVYSPDSNTMYSVTTGLPTWTSPYQPDGDSTDYIAGAVTSSYVVFESEGQVIAVPWQ